MGSSWVESASFSLPVCVCVWVRRQQTRPSPPSHLTSPPCPIPPPSALLPTCFFMPCCVVGNLHRQGRQAAPQAACRPRHIFPQARRDGLVHSFLPLTFLIITPDCSPSPTTPTRTSSALQTCLPAGLGTTTTTTTAGGPPQRHSRSSRGGTCWSSSRRHKEVEEARRTGSC